MSQIPETLNGATGRFEMETRDELAPIEKHPNIRKLIKDFNGTVDPTTGKVTFPPTYRPQGGGGLEGGSGGQQTNPMAGVRYYSRPGAIFRHVNQVQSIPSDIWSDVGKKITTLPAGFPSMEPTTNDNGEQIQYYWIVMAPEIYRRGNAYEIVRSYKMSEFNAPSSLYRDGTARKNE